MKIKIYIVTYKNENFLKDNINSILESDVINYDFSINVINNYTSHFSLIDFCNSNKINVIQNQARPDFSTGHLSRNWNQGLINGFINLKNPDADIVVLVQNDSLFQKNWASYIVESHKRYDFITMGGGDQFHSYTKEHIIKVGIWDERFCNIGYQEYDYFIRSYLYNRERSSINDPKHKRVHNKIDNCIILDDDRLIGGMRQDPLHLESTKYHSISKSVLIRKWGEESEKSWDINFFNTLSYSNIPNSILYPYFECDIDLNGKNYII